MNGNDPCPSCFCEGVHLKWQDCQAALVREDLRSVARYSRPKSHGRLARDYYQGSGSREW